MHFDKFIYLLLVGPILRGEACVKSSDFCDLSNLPLWYILKLSHLILEPINVILQVTHDASLALQTRYLGTQVFVFKLELLNPGFLHSVNDSGGRAHDNTFLSNWLVKSVHIGWVLRAWSEGRYKTFTCIGMSFEVTQGRLVNSWLHDRCPGCSCKQLGCRLWRAHSRFTVTS
jgi:hypothetical protein